MFNDVCFFNGVKMRVLNRYVANLIYTLTGMRSFKEVKEHFEDYPYDVITNNGRKYFICVIVLVAILIILVEKLNLI